MKIGNVWIVVSQDFLDGFKNETHPEAVLKLLPKLRARVKYKERFPRTTLGGKEVIPFSLYLDDNFGKIRDKLDELLTEYPTDFGVVGAWWWDGRQAGTQWVDENDPDLGVTGSPTFPIPNWAWKILPPSIDEDGNPVPATSNADLRDVVTMWGQSPRRFT